LKISICIPTYKRTDLLFESFQQVINDERVGEIVIVDDASPAHIYAEIEGFCGSNPKIKLYRNERNLDCYRNKMESVAKASHEYVILFDSDNVLTTKYIDVIYSQHWSPERILQPTFAKPHFDFRKYNGLLLNRKNVAKYAHDSTFTTALNAMNFFVCRDMYLDAWNDKVDPVTSDSIYFNYCWLAEGNSIYFTPGLEYEHKVHEGSHYKQNNHRTAKGFHESIVKKLKALR
jgi:glycosyltransferase involved in cell wall biosynthesis